MGWHGGVVETRTHRRPDVVKVIFRGPNIEHLAPYRIAMTSGNYYSSLRITGSGVRFSEETLRFPTGVNPVLTTEEVGQVIQSPAVSTLSQALRQASLIADSVGGVDLKMNMSGDFPDTLGFGIHNRLTKIKDQVWSVASSDLTPSGQSLEMVPATNLGDFEDEWVSKNLGNLEDTWVGKTLGELNLRPLWVG